LLSKGKKVSPKSVWSCSFFFPPTSGPPRHTHTHTHNQGGRRGELTRSCRCRGDGPTHILPLGRRAVTQPSQLEAPPARGHATKCPVPPGVPCLLFLRSSPIESLVLVSAPPVRRAVARLAELRAPRRMYACASQRLFVFDVHLLVQPPISAVFTPGAPAPSGGLFFH
jgi:hypothetical protein